VLGPAGSFFRAPGFRVADRGGSAFSGFFSAALESAFLSAGLTAAAFFSADAAGLAEALLS
jgi:hypothetical protein